MTILKKIALLKIWLGNGQGYINDGKWPVMLLIGLKVYFPTISLPLTLAMMLCLIITTVFVGWLDMRFIRLHQKIAEISTEKYNPYFSKLKKSLKGMKRIKN